MDSDELARELIGTIVADRYRVLDVLGAGGMGTVYLAEHVFTKRRVALKRMHPELGRSKLAAERFIRESQAPSTIGHPGIVQVLDGGSQPDGSLYIVHELLEGQWLRGWMGDPGPSLERRTRWLRDAARGLASRS